MTYDAHEARDWHFLVNQSLGLITLKPVYIILSEISRPERWPVNAI